MPLPFRVAVLILIVDGRVPVDISFFFIYEISDITLKLKDDFSFHLWID